MKKILNSISFRRKAIFALVVTLLLLINSFSQANRTLSATTELNTGDGDSQTILLQNGGEPLKQSSGGLEEVGGPVGEECDPKVDKNCNCDPLTELCTKPVVPCDPKTEVCDQPAAPCDPKTNSKCVCDDTDTCAIDECDPVLDKDRGCIANGIGGGYYPDGTDGDTGTDGDGGGPQPVGDVDICGFAWGATSEPVIPKMGAGWISFNSKDCDTNGDGTITTADNAPNGCPLPGTSVRSYGVKFSNTTRDLSGYAWSSNYGWLKFGGLSGFPTSGGNNAQDAHINGDGTATGWARFCAGTATGDCGTSQARSDGWDGWLSLRGTSPTYGVSLASSNFSGYAWGDDVVGWINWNAGSGSSVRYCTAASNSLGVNLTAIPSSTNQGSLNDVDLTATLSGTATGPATLKFDCRNDGTYELVVNNITGTSYTANDLCDYGSTGQYTAKVEVTRSDFATPVSATASILVSDQNTGPGPGGDLHATCTVSTPAFVGFPVTWTVTVDTPSFPPYDYDFSFSDGQGNTTIPDSDHTVERVVTTYTTPGSRRLTATITDSAAAPTTVECTKSANVIIKPNIIPI